MNYTITIYKRLGVEPHSHEPLYATWINKLGIEPDPGAIWEPLRKFEVATVEPIPAALCGLLLMLSLQATASFDSSPTLGWGPLKMIC